MKYPVTGDWSVWESTLEFGQPAQIPGVGQNAQVLEEEIPGGEDLLIVAEVTAPTGQDDNPVDLRITFDNDDNLIFGISQENNELLGEGLGEDLFDSLANPQPEGGWPQRTVVKVAHGLGRGILRIQYGLRRAGAALRVSVITLSNRVQEALENFVTGCNVCTIIVRSVIQFSLSALGVPVPSLSTILGEIGNATGIGERVTQDLNTRLDELENHIETELNQQLNRFANLPVRIIRAIEGIWQRLIQFIREGNWILNPIGRISREACGAAGYCEQENQPAT